MLADASLRGVSLGGTSGLAGAFQRGASLSDTFLLADAPHIIRTHLALNGTW
jgi:hypothetical protein